MTDAVADYLKRLERALRSLPAEDRAAIVAEIKSHIEDRIAATGLLPHDALASLGDPVELAAAYLDQMRLEQAVARSAHGELLVTILERAGRSLAAAALGFSALFFFCVTLGFALLAVAKPIVPQQTGLWIGPDFLALAVLDKTPQGGHELLGYWIIPLGLVLGTLSFLAARALIRLGGRVLLRRSAVLPPA